MRAGDDSPVPVLAYVLEQVLRLLHPFMPFITEEIWGNLTGYLPVETEAPPALIVASYPEGEPSLIDEQAESDIGGVVEIVRAIRNLRAEFRIPPSRPIEAIVDAPAIAGVVESESAAIKALAQVDPLRFASSSTNEGAGSDDRVSLVLSSGTVIVPLGGLVDIAQEKSRLSGELEQIESNLKRLSSRLANEDFLSKAPRQVVDKERGRLSDMEDRRARVESTLARLGS